ncbi:hypothetical protein HNP38_002497 [Chryseobacterium defluvii]|uniref:C1q domain-containing protein n=1 Tax=Chryseobacterium defluvii TaxID=160396 RepID=A0A840KI76_9FLAO|nr:hypothetical protein [Chryseobacterium defluvii]MBB4807193.1 hypothetical protein [Chryseobacterium defluvii]
MKNILTLFAIIGLLHISKAQVGINTASPGSTLDVRGSFATPLQSVTASTLGDKNQSVINFTNSGTFTLPAAISGEGNFGGREYQIRNGGYSNVVTIQTSNAETIDNIGSLVSTFNVPGGYIVTIKNTGATSGNTWMITHMTNTNVNQSNTSQIIYSGNIGDTSKTVIVGNFIFRFSGVAPGTPPGSVSPQIAMVNNPGTTVNINVGVNQQYSTDGFEYANNTFSFTPANYSTFRDIPATGAHMAPNELNIMNLVDTTNGRYYRITFYVSGSSAPYTFTIVAEKF